MNLDFGILWIEDTFNADEEDRLKRRVREAGFISRIEVYPNGESIDELGRKQAMFHCFDLILLDYKLKNADGDDLAPRVRQLFPSTTILFYSGNEDEDGLRSKIASRRVEGVYCSRRERFIERTGALIDQTARVLDRLSGMRGLAMRVVSECDALMKDAVRGMTLVNPACNDLLVDLDDDVNNHLDQIKEIYGNATAVDLEARLETFAVDSAKLYKHFRRLTKMATKNQVDFGLSNAQVDRLRELRRTSAKFDVDVLRKRNILGHAREIVSEDGYTLEESAGIAVRDFPGIRESFATYIDAFREINTLVIPRNG